MVMIKHSDCRSKRIMYMQGKPQKSTFLGLATKRERGGGKALVAGPLEKKITFFAASLYNVNQAYILHHFYMF